MIEEGEGPEGTQTPPGNGVKNVAPQLSSNIAIRALRCRIVDGEVSLLEAVACTPYVVYST